MLVIVCRLVVLFCRLLWVIGVLALCGDVFGCDLVCVSLV